MSRTCFVVEINIRECIYFCDGHFWFIHIYIYMYDEYLYIYIYILGTAYAVMRTPCGKVPCLFLQQA